MTKQRQAIFKSAWDKLSDEERKAVGLFQMEVIWKDVVIYRLLMTTTDALKLAESQRSPSMIPAQGFDYEREQECVADEPTIR